MQGMGLPIGKEKKVCSFMEFSFGYSIKEKTFFSFPIGRPMPCMGPS